MDTMNDLIFLGDVPERLSPQARLGGSYGAQGISGVQPYLTPAPFFQQGGAEQIDQRNTEAGISIYGVANDMVLGASTIYEPTSLPVGLNNGVYHVIGEGAGF